jgi:hypothetical protein
MLDTLGSIPAFKQIFHSELENQLFFIDKIIDLKNKYDLKVLKKIIEISS